MNLATYQLIILGNSNRFHQQILDTFFTRVEELGLDRDLIEIVNRNNFFTHYKASNPVVVLYYGGVSHPDLDIIETVKDDASIILPVFNSQVTFSDDIPEVLHPINGIKIEIETDIEPLVNNILEGFSLLRLSRRLFISYKRNESRGVAIQLFERLEQAGFDVFLDTHSIQKGDIFQDELWHRLVDTDVVVLLNTEGFLNSDWTPEELARANAMSIGILQLVWPENVPERSAQISIPLKLTSDNFVESHFTDSNDNLTDVTLQDVVTQVERLRARSLAARQDNIITEFIKFAKEQNRIVTLQREKYITFIDKDGEENVIIPTIGVPHAFSYHQSQELIKLIRSHNVKKIYLLYDHRNIRKRWLEHLAWLDDYLPVSSIKVLEVDQWLKTI